MLDRINVPYQYLDRDIIWDINNNATNQLFMACRSERGYYSARYLISNSGCWKLEKNPDPFGDPQMAAKNGSRPPDIGMPWSPIRFECYDTVIFIGNMCFVTVLAIRHMLTLWQKSNMASMWLSLRSRNHHFTFTSRQRRRGGEFSTFYWASHFFCATYWPWTKVAKPSGHSHPTEMDESLLIPPYNSFMISPTQGNIVDFADDVLFCLSPTPGVALGPQPSQWLGKGKIPVNPPPSMGGGTLKPLCNYCTGGANGGQIILSHHISGIKSHEFIIKKCADLSNVVV